MYRDLVYAQAEDRLCFMAVLRHTGRGDLATFAGPGEDDANINAGVLQLKRADYTEAELERMIKTAASQSAEAREVLQDFASCGAEGCARSTSSR